MSGLTEGFISKKKLLGLHHCLQTKIVCMHNDEPNHLKKIRIILL